MEISAGNTSNSNYEILLKEHPPFYDILVDFTRDKYLGKVEIFKESGGNIFTAKMKTHGYGLVFTSDLPEHPQVSMIYAIAKPLFTDPKIDDLIVLAEGPLNWDILYIIKDNLIELILKK